MSIKPKICTAILLAGLSLLFVTVPAKAQLYQVKVTDLTGGSTFTAIVVATHREGVKLFTLGQPASVPLEEIAEGGLISDMETMLRNDKSVFRVTDNSDNNGLGPTPFLQPGQTTTIMIRARGPYDHLSLVSMLLPTNDAFFALNDVPLPGGEHSEHGVEGHRGERTVTYYAPAYDAGTEQDDELCTDIPGPQCGGAGEGYDPSRTGAPNFVFVHAGIHGIGNIPDWSTHDWRNPVAKIQITEVHGEH